MENKSNNLLKIVITILLVFLLAGIGVFFIMKDNSKITYTNPVGGMTDIGDPFILKVDDMYYLYATSAASYGFKVWQSNNLVDWEDKGDAYDHYYQDERWAFGDFWAPEVIYYKDKFYMTYSARNEEGSLQIAVAVSDDPLGPFIDYSTEIIPFEGSYIDGHIFIEDDGTPYLYYVKDCSENIIDGNHVSQIFVQKMNKSLTEVVGEPVLLLEPDQVWEGAGNDWQWNEGPFVLKHEGKYYLMYSANFYASSDYSIGYAVSDSPMGPFEKAKEPLLQKDLAQGISGPGHNSVTLGLDNKTMYIVYHIHTYPEEPSGNRQMALDRLYFENGKLKVDRPTKSEQKLR